MGTFHAEPVTLGDVVEADAVRVVGCIAAVAEEEDILSLCRVADGAWIGFFFLFFWVLPKPLLHIELGNLLFVLDFVGGNGDACRFTSLISSCIDVICEKPPPRCVDREGKQRGCESYRYLPSTPL